jgi:hypothetical protein
MKVGDDAIEQRAVRVLFPGVVFSIYPDGQGYP